MVMRILISLIGVGLLSAGTWAEQAAPQGSDRRPLFSTYTDSPDTVAQPLQGDPRYKAKRINRAVELLEAGQPVWFTGATGERDYEDGKRMAQTFADYIDYPLEHEPFDMGKLRRFMQGLVHRARRRFGEATLNSTRGTRRG